MSENYPKFLVVYSDADDGVSHPENYSLCAPSADDGYVHLEVNATGTGTYVELGATAEKTRHDGLGVPYEVVTGLGRDELIFLGNGWSICIPQTLSLLSGKVVSTKVRDTPYEITYSV